MMMVMMLNKLFVKFKSENSMANGLLCVGRSMKMKSNNEAHSLCVSLSFTLSYGHKMNGNKEIL